MVVFVVKRYAVRNAKKWRYAVRNAKIERYAVRKGGGGCHPHLVVNALDVNPSRAEWHMVETARSRLDL